MLYSTEYFTQAGFNNPPQPTAAPSLFLRNLCQGQRQLIRSAAALFIFFAAVQFITLHAQEQQKEGIADTVAAVYELGYFKEYSINSARTVQDIIFQLTEEQQDTAFAGIIADHFKAELMQEAMLGSLRRSYRAGPARKSIAHLQQPSIQALMQQLYASRVNLEDAETQQEFERYAARMERIAEEAPDSENEAGQQRISLVAEIVQETRQLALTVQGLEEMLAIVVFAVNQSKAAEERLSDRELNDLLLTLRANFRAFFEDMMLYINLFALKDQPTDSLQQHLEFLRSDSGKWFVRSYNNAVLDSYDELGKAISEALAQWAITSTNTD